MRVTSITLLTWALVAATGSVHQKSASDGPPSLAVRLGSEGSGPPVQLADLPALRERVGYDALDKQFQALMRMPSVTVQYAINGTARKITGSTGIYLPANTFRSNEAAPRVMEALGAVVLATGTEELRVKRIHDPQSWLGSDGAPRLPERTIKFEQYIRGRPVLLGWANIAVSESSGEVTTFASHFLPDRGLPSEPKISAAAATEKLLASMRDDAGKEPVELILSNAAPTLAYAFHTIGDQGASSGDLVWVISVARKDSKSLQHLQAAVSATTGEVLRFAWESHGSLFRVAYTANGVATPPPNFPQGLTFLFGEGMSPNDQRAGEAYNHAGTTYQAYQQAFSRNSMNGAGGAIKLVVHYPFPAPGVALYHNDYLVFGEGSGDIVPPTSNLDTVSHEYGHGVVAADAQFALANDLVDRATALNEGYADLSSTIADVHLNGTPSNSTWTMLELFASNPVAGFRYWNVPTLAGVQYRDWCPERSLLVLSEGGHYYNTTILGHAFYLLTNGGTHYRAGLPGSGIPVITVTRRHGMLSILHSPIRRSAPPPASSNTETPQS